MKEVAVILGLIYNDSNELFLMTSNKWEGYGLPGGKPLAGESEEQTLKREVKEEIGIEITDLVKSKEIIMPPTKQIFTGGVFLVKPYYAKAVTTSITPNEEVGSYGWYTRKKALELPLLDAVRKTIEYQRLLR